MGKTRDTRGRLSLQQEIFITEVLKGTPQRHAYLAAYPAHREWAWPSIDAAASALAKNPKVKTRLENRLRECRAVEQQEALWDREQSIVALKKVIEQNQKELQRIDESYEEEIQMLIDRVEKNPKKASAYIKEVLLKKRSRRVSSIYNNGIVAAVAELNKMQGFNEQNINLNGSVVFEGEDEIPE